MIKNRYYFKSIIGAVSTIMILLLPVGIANAGVDCEEDDVICEQIRCAINEEDFKGALKLLNKELKNDGKNPALLSMLFEITSDFEKSTYDPLKAIKTGEKLVSISEDESEKEDWNETVAVFWEEYVYDKIEKAASKKTNIAYADCIKKQVPIHIYFYADWCGNCKVMNTAVDDLKDKWSNEVLILKVNVDTDFISDEYTEIQAVPTNVFVTRKGNKKFITGAISGETIEKIYLFITDFSGERIKVDGETLDKYFKRILK